MVIVLAIAGFRIHGAPASDAAVARELAKHRLFAEHGTRTLAAYLGQLRAGNSRWWRSRPEQLRAVAELTGLELADFGFSDAGPSQAYAFPTFPALRPLDLLSEPLPDIYKDAGLQQDWEYKTDFWLDPDSRHPLDRPAPGLYWLQIPPGHGLDLLWRRAVARGHAQCREIATLGKTLPHQVGGKPIILRVAQPVPAEWERQAGDEPPTSPVLVLSRHAPPLTVEPDSRLSAFLSRQLRGLPPLILSKGMRRDLVADWQDRLVEWAVARLQATDTLFSGSDIRRWVDSLLPYRSVVSTPDELIALGGVLHQTGHAHRAATQGAPLFHACSSNPAVATRLARVLKHRYLHGAASWDEPLPPEDWAQHLQPGIADTASIASLVHSVVEEKSLSRRRQAKAALLTPPADLALSELTNDFALVRHDDGHYHTRLPFLANALVADEVFDLVENGRTQEWARLYLDPSRRIVVEMALWRRTLRQLVADARNVLSHPESPLIQLTAEEALFWSIGFKLAQSDSAIASPAQAVLQALASRVVARTAMGSSKPATRDLEAHDEALAWVAVCWHWSINVAFPQTTQFPAYLAWLFPGWADRENLLNYAPGDLPVESSEALEHTTTGAGRAAWALWWSAAQRIANELSAAPAEPPDALAPAIVLTGLCRGWAIDPQWVRSMGRPSALTPFLRRSVAELDAGPRKRLLDVALTAVDWRSNTGATAETSSRETARNQVDAMMLPQSWLVQDVINGLDARAVVDVTGPARFSHLVMCLDPANTAVICEFAQALPRTSGWSETFLELLPILPRESLAMAVEWINFHPNARIAAWFWRQDAEATMAMLTQASQLSEIAISLLLHLAPSEYTAAVAELLIETQNPALLDHRAAWALDRLPHYGLKLEKLINRLAVDEWSAHAGMRSQAEGQ